LQNTKDSFYYLTELIRLNVNKKYLFITNPISGGKKSASLHKIVYSTVRQIVNADLAVTEYPGHGRELAANAVEKGYDVVVAVGGDGTVNEVASSLVGTETALGIVPLGSGNGLARHLGIPLLPEKAIENILKSKPVTIDSAVINGTPFFCTAGIGFDAQVAMDYAEDGARGLTTYIKNAVKDWTTYKSGEYIIETEEGRIQTRALLITVGNANQWGNNFFITPTASLCDGKLDVTIVKPASIISNLSMIRQLRNKTLTKNPDVMFLKSSYVKIEHLSPEKTAAHYDGDVTSLDRNIYIECKNSSLKAIPCFESQKI